jgi:transcriptional regulator with XRE-family HTH domain
MARRPDRQLTRAIDAYVGNRVRLRRLIVGMSQQRLGEALGITFQQVQKYEKGANRVCASRLLQISQVLGVPVAFFYEGALQGGDGALGADAEAAFLTSTLNEPMTLRLVRAFAGVEESLQRQRIVELVEAVGGVPVEGGHQRERTDRDQPRP